MNEKKQQLISLSKQLKVAMDCGIIEQMKINEAIVEHYKTLNSEISEFKTFNQWKKDGMKVKKGSKSFAVWSKPIKAKQKTEEDESEYKFFSVCNLFADTQVEKQ